MRSNEIDEVIRIDDDDLYWTKSNHFADNYSSSSFITTKASSKVLNISLVIQTFTWKYQMVYWFVVADLSRLLRLTGGRLPEVAVVGKQELQLHDGC